MKKRAISMFLCLCMVFTMVGAIVPAARAATDTLGFPFGKEITSDNPYGGTQNLHEATTYPCTLYVWQRVKKDYGISLPKWGWAKNWFSGAENDDRYETGDVAIPGSIVVYDGIGNGDDKYGHVAYVTEVYGNRMTVDEGGRTKWAATTGGIGTSTNMVTKVGDPEPQLGNYKVLGYIYLSHVDPPAAPDSITGTWTSTGPTWQAGISWNAVSGATGYEVEYRTPTTNGGWSAWKTDGDYKSGTSYISTGLGNYDTYEYRVRAVNAGGASNWKTYPLQKPGAVTPPARPKNVFASWTLSGKMTARVSWPAVSGAEYYNVQYKKANESFWCSTSPVRSGTSYTFPELGADASWDFRVEAVNAGGSSGWTECSLPAQKNIISTILKPPSVIAAPANVSGKWKSTGSNASAELTWNTVSDADFYEIEYKKAGGSWGTIPQCPGKLTTSYAFNNLDSSSSYSFRIKAVKGNVSSAWVEYTLEREKGLAAPSGVSGVWTSTGSKWQARISWNAVNGATRYEVQYRTPTTGNEWRTDSDYSSGTSYISTGLGNYNSYDYRVRAVNASGASGWTEYTLFKTVSTPEPTPSQTTSAPSSTEVTPPFPAAPSGVSGSWTSTGPKWQARISWNAVSGATRYEVQYRTPTTGNAWRTDADYSSGTSYISTGLGNYNSYDYRVRAVNANGASDWTEYTLVKTVSTPAPAPATTAPAAPTNVSGTWTSRGPNWQARISWNAVSGAMRYEVQYRTPRTGNEWRTDADYSSGTSYISTGLGSYNSYDYRVRAVNANGASDWTEYTLYK